MPAPPSKPKFTGGRYGSRQYDPNNRSLQAWFSGTGAWHPQNQGPKYTPQYQSIQPFKREVGQVMTPQTGPSQLSMSADSARDRRSHQSMLLPSISGFAPNQIPQGDPPVANPFERRVPRPQTITAGSPMTQPLNQQGSRLFPRPNQQNAQTSFRAPTSYNVLPPINPAMRQQARQWAGQPMPPNVQPPETPYATPPVNYQRAPGGQMAGPSTQTTGIGRLITSRPRNADSVYDAVPTGDKFDTPYYNARRARNATGQGSPYIPKGEEMTYDQRREGYAAMAQNGGQSPTAFGPGHPLWGKTPDQARQEIARLQGLNADPNAYNAQNYVSPDGRRYDATPVSPAAQLGLANPIGTREVGGMEFSGTNRPGGLALVNNRLPQAGNREEGLARLNMRGLGQTPTLEQAAADPNFNQDGRFFQGARLGVNQNGGAFFREGERPTDFAGNAQTAQEAGANRLRGLQALEQRGVGYVDPNTGAFIGRGARTFASDGPGMNALAGRLAAGGVTPTALSAGQLNDNRVAMLGRMAGQRERAMARVQSLAQQSTADRRERMNPDPLKRLMANNPQIAAMQMQQQGAERIAQLQNQGRIDVAKAEADAQAARMPWALAAAGVNAGQPIDQAGRQAGLPQFANAPQPGAIPQAKPGAFAGVDKGTFDFFKEQAKDMNDDDTMSLFEEAGVPVEQRAALLERVKPNMWRRLKGDTNGQAGGGGATGFQLGPINFGPFGPRWGS